MLSWASALQCWREGSDINVEVFKLPNHKGSSMRVFKFHTHTLKGFSLFSPRVLTAEVGPHWPRSVSQGKLW